MLCDWKILASGVRTATRMIRFGKCSKFGWANTPGIEVPQRYNFLTHLVRSVPSGRKNRPSRRSFNGIAAFFYIRPRDFLLHPGLPTFDG